jgi:hypothetical protein
MAKENVSRKIKKSTGDKWFDFIMYTIAVIITIIVLYHHCIDQ